MANQNFMPFNGYSSSYPSMNSGSYATPTYSGYGQYQPQTQPAQPVQSPQPQNVVTAPMPRQTINGRFISNISEVTPNEVPMDGTASIFPVNDGSCVYVRFWNTEGNIQTLKFVPEKPTESVQTTSDLDILMNKLNAIEAKLSNKKPYYKNNQRNNKPKKEDDSNV